MVNKGISQHDSLVILPKVFVFQNFVLAPTELPFLG